MTGSPPQATSALQELLAGSVAGAAATLAGHPFDTVKVRMQSHLHNYRGPLSCLRHVVRYEGLPALYRGLSPPLAASIVETGVCYMVYRRVRASLEERDGREEWYHAPLAGAFAGAGTGVVCGPVELIKVRLQASHMEFHGPLQCARHLLATEGWRGLGRGLGATMLREVPGTAVLFSSYELVRRSMLPDEEQAPKDTLWRGFQEASAAILAGGLSGVAYWSLILPIDVAKTRIQLADPGSKMDVGVRDQLRLLLRRGGWSALWTGMSATLFRAFPENACQWLAWEVGIRHVPPSL